MTFKYNPKRRECLSQPLQCSFTIKWHKRWEHGKLPSKKVFTCLVVRASSKKKNTEIMQAKALPWLPVTSSVYRHLKEQERQERSRFASLYNVSKEGVRGWISMTYGFQMRKFHCFYMTLIWLPAQLSSLRWRREKNAIGEWVMKWYKLTALHLKSIEGMAL